MYKHSNSFVSPHFFTPLDLEHMLKIDSYSWDIVSELQDSKECTGVWPCGSG